MKPSFYAGRTTHPLGGRSTREIAIAEEQRAAEAADTLDAPINWEREVNGRVEVYADGALWRFDAASRWYEREVTGQGWGRVAPGSLSIPRAVRARLDPDS